MRKVKKIKLGFIGLGRIFRLGYENRLAAWLAGRPDVELTALSDTNERLCREYHRKFKAPVWADPLEMLDTGRVNAVVISSPNWAHEEQVIAAAANGAHVLCEKPMAPSEAACRRMNEACAAAGVALQISFMRRFSPAFQRIRRMILDGALGDLIELNCVWPYFLADLDSPPFSDALDAIKSVSGYDVAREWGAWRLKDKRCGGGDFLDHGPHICDIFTWFAGRISHVSGESRVMVPGRNEDFTVCRLKFHGGAFGSVTTTLYDYASGITGRVDGYVRGTAGRIDFVMPDTNVFKPIRFTYYGMPKSDAGKLLRALGVAQGREMRFREPSLFMAQLDYFADTLLGKRKPHPLFGDEDFAATGADGEYTIRIVEKTYESSRKAPRWLKI